VGYQGSKKIIDIGLLGGVFEPSRVMYGLLICVSKRREVFHMEKNWYGSESRWGERVRVNIPVQVSANALSAEGYMKNLSLSGALVKADGDLKLHALVKVSIDMPSRLRRTAELTAYVSRKSPEGVGVEWCEFAPGVVKDLLRAPAIPLPG
jgi:hypothetical protein